MMYRKIPYLLWLKVKKKNFAALEKGNNVKRQKIRTGDDETLETAVFKWFLSLRSQNVPLSGGIIQCVPNKIYQLKSEKCSGGKSSKVRITGINGISECCLREITDVCH